MNELLYQKPQDLVNQRLNKSWTLKDVQKLIAKTKQPLIRGAGNKGNSFLSFPVGGFSPTDVSNLYAWYDASDSSTITKSADRVSQWNNKEGTTARDLVQATGGSQPLWVSADQNGKDVIDFAGDRFMLTSSELTSIAQPITIFSVSQILAVQDRLLLDGHTTSATRYNYVVLSSTADRTTFNAGATITASSITGFSGAVKQISVLASGASSFIRVAGVEKVAGNAGTVNYAGIRMGNNPSGSVHFDAKIMELLIYHKNVSGTELTDVESYLSTKWNTS